jgi:hypothetical protein
MREKRWQIEKFDRAIIFTCRLQYLFLKRIKDMIIITSS